MKLKIKILLILLLDLIFSVFAVYNIFLIKEKPTLPFFNSLDGLIFDEDYESFLKYDKILSINSIQFLNKEEIEFFCDKLKIGDNVLVDIRRNGEIITKNIPLVNFYSNSYLIIIFFIGFSFFVTGIFVLLKNPDLTFAYVFHWLTLSASGMIFLTWGKIQLDNVIPSFIIRTLFDISLILVPITLIHFSLIFPKNKFLTFLRNFKYVYLIVFIFWIILIYYNINVFQTILDPNSIAIFRKYNFMHTNHSKVMMVPAMILVIFNFIHSYFKTVEEDEKRKLKWIFIGLLTGPFVYTFFYSMPRLDGNPLISEELMLLILIIAPITFLIAIFRYRIIDINFIVSKGMVYSLIVLIFSLIYVILIAIVANTIEPIFTNFKIIGVDLIYVLISIFAIFIFQPVKNIVQHYIDRKFYRVKYNYKVILSNFLNKIRDIHNESQIVELIVSSINRAIPISSYLILWRNGQIQILYSDDFDYNNQTFDKIDSFIRSSGCRPIYSNSISVEEDLKFTELDKELSNEGIELILNSFSGSDKPKLTFIFGKKKAENKFSLEDVELLNTILDSSSVAINRIKLQTELILKQNEAEKLKEINEVKSYFVSSVSHELKTPLTAIKLYAEFLNSNPNLTDEKKKNYLAIIEGECNRLDRLINNVLGFSKIEKGTKKYRFDFVDLKKIIDYIIETFQYQLNMQNFQVDFYADKYEDFTIYADEDALKEVFINLISNSIKYSISEKLIVIRLSVESDYCIFSISDKGVGINSEEISKIFTPFFRSNEKNISSLGGAGLGLAIVKNILDAHSAEISVESEIGKGTSFKIKFQRKT